MQPPTPYLAPRDKNLARIRTAVEALWLIALVLVPIAILPDRAMTFIESTKVAVYRLIAVALVGLMVWEWALTRQSAAAKPRLREWLKRDPSHWIIAAALAVLAVTVLTAALSPMPSVSFLGREHGRDSISVYSVATYVIFFLAIATHLRGMAQVRRLLWAVTAAALLASAYAFSQHYGFDPIRSDQAGNARAGSAMGNPIFFGAYLVMALPLSLAVLVQSTARLRPLPRILVIAAPLTLQSAGLLFTLSRGPWVGMLAGIIVLGVLAAFLLPRRLLAISAASVAVAGVAALLISYIPNATGNDRAASPVTSRAATIVGEITTGGLTGRIKIWEGAGTLAASHPWPDTAAYPEIPDLRARPVRHLTGYGPDMFLFVHPLAAQPQLESVRNYHAHNFLINTLVEQGALGLLSIAAMILAIVAVAVRHLRRARRQPYPEATAVLLVALFGALAGRFVEQLTGIAQISDAMLFWTIVALLAALPAVLHEDAEPQPAPATQLETTSAAPPATALPGIKIGAALLVTVGLVALIWFGNMRYVVASTLGAQAGRAFDNGHGDLDASLTKLDRAVSWAPDVQAYRLNKSTVLLAKADRAQDPQERLRLLALGHDALIGGLRNNPMDQLMWAKNAEYLQAMDEITETLGQPTLRAYQVMTALLPGYWIVRNAEAGAYLRLDQPEQALETIAASLRITGSDRPEASTALYLQGAALSKLGRLAEAAQSLEQSLKLVPLGANTEETYRILSELYLNVDQRDRAFQSRAQYSYVLSVRLIGEGRTAEAIASLQQTLSLDPNGPRSSKAQQLLARLQGEATQPGGAAQSGASGGY